MLLSIYTIAINNNSVLSNSLTNNRVLYIDNSGKLNTTDTTPDELIDIKNNIANIQDTLSNTQQQLDGKQGIITIDDELNSSSSNPIANKTVKSALDGKQNVLTKGNGISLDNNTVAINKAELLDMIYPVGSIYISVNNVSPATFLGGNWEQIKDKFLLSAGSSYSAGSTGGEATHTLTTNELPSHNHTISHTHTRGSMNITGYFTGQYSVYNQSYGGAMYRYASYGHGFSGGGGGGEGVGFDASRNWTGSTSEPSNANSGNSGNGQAHNNMPPYVAVYMWKRIN